MFESMKFREKNAYSVLRHLVFRDVETGLYYLRQTDYLYANGPEAVAKASAQQLGYAVELFLEESPSQRAKGVPSISDAIAAWHKELEP